MRPVNLIPPEARRGEKAPMRTGALSYVIVAVLAVALLGVTAIVITEDVWLTNLTATVNPEVQIDDSGSSSSSSSGSGVLKSVQGPSLQIEGCGASHEAVARFLAALRDIDGVTRVSV